jgi:hypothetical protein
LPRLGENTIALIAPDRLADRDIQASLSRPFG